MKFFFEKKVCFLLNERVELNEYVSGEAVITEHCRMGGLSNKTPFSDLEARSPRSGWEWGWFQRNLSSWLAGGHLLAVSSHGLSSVHAPLVSPPLLLRTPVLLTPWKESYDQPRQQIKKQRHYFANKGPSSQGYGFSTGHVWLWGLDYKQSWVPKNWCFWTVVLEKTLESPLDWKDIQPVHPKGDQSWVFIGRTDVEAETPILWPPDAKSWLIWKDPDAGKDWGQEEKGITEDKMVGWHHRLDGHEFG